MHLDITDSLPKTLFKYREISNDFHLKVISDQELYFSKPSKFNATHDCDVLVDKESIQNENKRREYYSKEIGIKNIYDVRIDELILKNPLTTELIDESEQRLRTNFDNFLGVLSLGTNPNNDFLWDVFAGQRTGFCIEVNHNSILDVSMGRRGYVEYVEEKDLPQVCLLDVHNHEKMIKYFFDSVFMLPKKYREEKEYRIVRLITDENQRIQKVAKESIRAIYLGDEMNEPDRERIKELVNINLPSCPIIE